MCNKTAYQNRRKHHSGMQFKRSGMHPWRMSWKDNYQSGFHQPPANVSEEDDKYELHLYAPGYNKSDFVIALIDHKLSISVDQKEAEKANWKRHEYFPKGFVRQFELNEKIDSAAISAKYESGVLIVSLPKLEGFETARKEIAIS